MALVRIVKDWDYPNLLRQTPGNSGIWENIQFTLDPVEQCDYLLILNNRIRKTVKTRCPRNNIWAIMQEPYIEDQHDWMLKGHKKFSRVYTHHLPSYNQKYISSQPAVPWHVNRTFDQLVSLRMPHKSRTLSCIVSDKTVWPGHKKRLLFVKTILNQISLNLDLFGSGFQYLEDKWDGLAPYKYSLAIENSSSPNYWTEKIADCFLCWTVPFYYGCNNLEKYFPEKAFIRIDIEKPKDSSEYIQSIIRQDDFVSRISALEEARELVLYKYQFFPYISNLIKYQKNIDYKRKYIKVKPYRKSIFDIIKYK